MGILSKVKKAVTKVAKVVTKPVKKVTQAAAKVVKSVSKPVAKAVSSVATGVKKVATNVVRAVAKAPAKVLGSVASGIKKAATSTLKSVGKVAAKVAVTAAKVSSKLGIAGHIIDVALVAYTGGAYAAVKLAAKKVITTYAASVVAKKLASTSKLAASVASALIGGGSTKSSLLKQAALSATKYAINKAGQQLAKKSSAVASAFNIYNGVSSVVALGKQARAVSSGAKQLGRYIAPASRALPAPNQKPTVQTFPLAAKGGATNIRALPSAAGSYTIKKGDSLWTISSRTGVPVAELMKANGINNPNLIRTGARLNIPVTTGAGKSSSLAAQNAAFVTGWNNSNKSSSLVNTAKGNGTTGTSQREKTLTIKITGGKEAEYCTQRVGFYPSRPSYIDPESLPQMKSWRDTLDKSEIDARSSTTLSLRQKTEELRKLAIERNAYNQEASLLDNAQHGELTKASANAWFRRGEGKPLYVDFSKIDLSAVTLDQFEHDENGVAKPTDINLQMPWNMGSLSAITSGLAFGSIKLYPKPDGTATSVCDEYDFDQKPWITETIGGTAKRIVRNVATFGGGIVAAQIPTANDVRSTWDRTQFDIIFHGSNSTLGATPTGTRKNTPMSAPNGMVTGNLRR